MTLRDQQRAETRQRIIEAAAQEFARNGFAGTSFTSVAAVLGKPRSAIGYESFPSKRALAEAVVDQHMDRLDALLDRVSAVERPGLEALMRALGAGSELDGSSPVAAGALRLLIEQYEDMGRARAEHALAFVRDNVRAALRDGEVPDGVDGGELARRLLTAALGAHSASLYRLTTGSVAEGVQSSWAIVLRDAGVSRERLDQLAARPTLPLD